MIRPFLSLALIVAIFDCPLVCGLAPTVCANEELVKRCCGCCHHRENPADDGSAPGNDFSDGDSSDGKALCQCICNGAVVEQAVSQPAGVDLDCWAPTPATTSLLATSHARLSFYRATNQPDDGMNVGRAMRCLFMSYLC